MWVWKSWSTKYIDCPDARNAGWQNVSRRATFILMWVAGSVIMEEQNSQVVSKIPESKTRGTWELPSVRETFCRPIQLQWCRPELQRALNYTQSFIWSPCLKIWLIWQNRKHHYWRWAVSFLETSFFTWQFHTSNKK